PPRTPAPNPPVQAPPVVAGGNQPEAEPRTLADTPLGPAPDARQRALPDERHRAVLDDRVALVPVMHPDPEKAIELPVRHPPEGARLEVAMSLRRLDDGDAGAAEVGDEVPQPVAIDRVVRVDDADQLGPGVGLAQ